MAGRERRRHSASRPVVLSGNVPVPAANRRKRKILRLRRPDAGFAQDDPLLIIASGNAMSIPGAPPSLCDHNASHPEPASGGASERRRRIFRFRRCAARGERRRHSASRPVVVSGNVPVPAANRRNRKILRLRAPNARFAQNDPLLIIAKRKWHVFPRHTRTLSRRVVGPGRIASACDS